MSYLQLPTCRAGRSRRGASLRLWGGIWNAREGRAAEDPAVFGRAALCAHDAGVVRDSHLGAGRTHEATAGGSLDLHLTPYLWATSLDGNAAVGGTKSDVDVPFRDIVPDLALGAMLMASVRKGPWGLAVNGLFARVSPEEKSDSLEIDVLSDMANAAVAPFYRLVEWTYRESPSGQPRRFVLEPYLGARLNYLRLELKLKPRGRFQNLPLPRRDRHHDASETWVDPLVGTRFGVDVSEGWFVAGAGDVGGVVVGSDLAWNVQGYLGYRSSLLGRPTTYAFGYRALRVEYDHHDFVWNVTQHGPIVGLALRF